MNEYHDAETTEVSAEQARSLLGVARLLDVWDHLQWDKPTQLRFNTTFWETRGRQEVAPYYIWNCLRTQEQYGWDVCICTNPVESYAEYLHRLYGIHPCESPLLNRFLWGAQWEAADPSPKGVVARIMWLMLTAVRNTVNIPANTGSLTYVVPREYAHNCDWGRVSTACVQARANKARDLEIILKVMHGQ